MLARPIRPTLTVSQRVRLMLWVQARPRVPASSAGHGLVQQEQLGPLGDGQREGELGALAA